LLEVSRGVTRPTREKNINKEMGAGGLPDGKNAQSSNLRMMQSNVEEHVRPSSRRGGWWKEECRATPKPLGVAESAAKDGAVVLIRPQKKEWGSSPDSWIYKEHRGVGRKKGQKKSLGGKGKASCRLAP